MTDCNLQICSYTFPTGCRRGVLREFRYRVPRFPLNIWIWGSPGHVMSEFAYYDTYTQILYTGDMFYRGRCYISFWQPWFDSMTRLMKFVDEHPVTHVIGCHVECSKTGEDYAYGMTYQPDEAPVQLTVAELRHAYEVAKTVKEPGIYFTGSVYLCNQTRSYTTIDRNPYAYA